MKKLSILLVTGIIYCWIPRVSAQSGTSITENFDGNITWISSPASAWKVDTNYYISPHNSIRGVVPNMTGEETTLTSPVYNLSSYSNVLLRFSHICKVSPIDIVRIEYKLRGQAWEVISTSSYKGNALGYQTNGFSSASYIEWQSNDSLVIPSQSWWKEESFALGSDVGGDSEVQFRFVLRHGATIGTQISYGWLIDNIEIIAMPEEIKLPVVEFIAPLVRGNVYSAGPWEINAKVKSQTANQIENPWLVYTATNSQGTVKDSVLMTMVAGDSLWKATIPQFVAGTEVIYSITGKVKGVNGNYTPVISGYIIAKPTHNYGNNSASLIAIISPIQGQLIGDTTTTIEVMLHNKGDADLTSASIYWRLNGVLQTPYSWTGNLPWDFKQQVTIGSYQPRSDVYDTIVIWISNPNNTTDPVLNDDTLSITTFGCITNMSGTYIIGEGEMFPTLKDALIVFNSCHPVGDIQLALKSGVYEETTDIRNISSFMGNYSLTITSFANNRDSVIFRPVSGVGIVLNSSNNIIIEHITIDVENSGTYGIQFTGHCSNIVIDNCNIFGKLIPTQAQTTYAPVYYYNYQGPAAGSLNNIRITNCTIQGGAYGIYLYSTNSNYSQNITIDSNVIRGQSFYGVYVYYVNLNSVSYNQLSPRSSNQSTSWYGLYFYYARNGGNIIGNRIRSDNPKISIVLYGMYFNYIVSVRKRINSFLQCIIVIRE
jgi:hypothetical protein